MTKNKHDLHSIREKIKAKQNDQSVEDIAKRFAAADKTLGIGEKDSGCDNQIVKVAKKTFSIPEEELAHINFIKDKALNKRLVISDSEAIRLGLLIATEVNDDDLVVFYKRLDILPKGRPKNK